MTLAELKAEAQKILALGTETEELIYFRTKSFGYPEDRVGLTDYIEYKGIQSRYSTPTPRGWAHAAEVVVRCAETDARDRNGRRIYILPDGRVFCYKYIPGSADSFDYGAFVDPEFGSGNG